MQTQSMTERQLLRTGDKAKFAGAGEFRMYSRPHRPLLSRGQLVLALITLSSLVAAIAVAGIH